MDNRDAAIEAAIERAAEAIAAADAILIGTGAGMGMDSGLPDFRGDSGFWNAYPPFRDLGLRFVDLANPRWFRSDPAQAWGFYGHRYHLYEATAPHEGFAILRRWGESQPHGGFVFTSNVDGHFQKAGFDPDQVFEVHGSIRHLQCALPCSDDIWPADDLHIEIDPATFRAAEPLPRCRHCGGLARPNVLMFGDGNWVGLRSGEQQRHYRRWLGRTDGVRTVVIECGAGMAVPTVRIECEMHGGRLIRINPREHHVPPGGIAIPLGTLEAVRRIDALIGPRDRDTAADAPAAG